MTYPGKPTQKGSTTANYPITVAVVGTQIGCITLVIVLAAVLGGLWLDKQLGTKFIITFILVIISAPLSMFLTYKIAVREMRRFTPAPGAPPPSTKKNYSTKEEEE
jgi:hypothetical protein